MAFQKQIFQTIEGGFALNDKEVLLRTKINQIFNLILFQQFNQFRHIEYVP